MYYENERKRPRCEKNRFYEKPTVEIIEIELDRGILDGSTPDFEEGGSGS